MGSGFGTLCGRKKSETPAPERSDPRIGHASDRMWSDIGKSRAERIREIWPICAHDVSLWVRMRRQIAGTRADFPQFSEMSDKRETGWWMTQSGANRSLAGKLPDNQGKYREFSVFC